jgi:bifunctional DNA-binding transcriptional regulator/antitoxin component of YhaV-PrlF toxin-antitoxin module
MSGGTSGGQLIIPDAAKKELTVAISKDVTREVYGFINKEIIPRVEGAINYMNYINQDGDEIVNQYRRRLHDTVNKPAKDAKLIAGKVGKKSEAEKLSDFQRSTLFFHDD